MNARFAVLCGDDNLTYQAFIMNNRYIKALTGLVLLSASIHIVILVIYSIINLDIRYLNYFNIIDVDLFLPEIADGPLSQILSIITIVVVFIVIYAGLTKKNKTLG
jgi:hypothetical protein